MSNNIYNILGRFNNLWSTEPTESVVDLGEPVYESIEAKGDITEAVKSLETKFETYKKEVSEGKKLKDKKQFDAVAEPGDYYLTDKGNKVIKTKSGIKHEKVHAADKDDEDLDEGVEVEESGLQAYLGKKKYGKEGMKALQKAGREGASKEKMAMLRAKHDKMDESAKPDYIDLDKDGNKTEPMKQAAKDAKKVDEVAPPGAKAERMVKHIKKGYAKDGKLTPKEKGIAYATAWKAHNKGKMEEATEFGDTIKNSEGKMTKVKVTEGKDAIRNHPIYTTKEAWDHYAQELAEQEAMEADCMETPVIDAVQELDEIAKLAGLTPKMEAKCSSCGCADCKCNESSCMIDETAITEAATRKDFRMVADLISKLPEKDRKEKAHHHADIFAKQNPRFKKDVFLKACGLEESTLGAVAGGVAGAALGKSPAAAQIGATIGDKLTDESINMDEGNEFTKARLDAIAAGKDSFSVGGKTYNVSGDTSQEKTQVEESTLVTEDVNINVTANGEEDVVKLIQKLAGMPVIAIQAQPEAAVAEEYCDACDSTECHCESVAEERDINWDNTPEELTAPISAAIPSGTDLNRSKRQDPHTANKAANPLGESQIEENLWKAYEEIINDVKA